MFDIAFSELLLIMVVALLVIGPERLPKVARTLGQWYGRARRYVNHVKSDLERDMAIEEFQKLQAQVQAQAQAAEQAVAQGARAVEQQVQQLNRAVAQPSAQAQHQLKDANESPQATRVKRDEQ